MKFILHIYRKVHSKYGMYGAHPKLWFKFICKPALPVCFFMIITIVAKAQDSTNALPAHSGDQPYISWISQYPAAKKEDKKQNAFKRIFNFLIKKDKQQTLVRPVAIVAAGTNDFCVLDQGCRTIFDVADTKADIPRCIKKKENYFTSLVGICSLPDKQMLFTDSRLNKIFIVSADKKKLSVFNDSLELQQPTGIAYSPATNEIWVVETNAHRISVLNDKGELIKTIGSRGDENGQFNFPTAISIDKAGDAYVVDAMNFRIEIFNKKGEFVSAFGEAGDAPGTFARPKGIATDTFGNIYVVDALFNVVQIFDRTGNFLYNFGKQGREKEEFWMPSGIYIDSKNFIYIADNYNSRVQIFQLINGS